MQVQIVPCASWITLHRASPTVAAHASTRPAQRCAARKNNAAQRASWRASSTPDRCTRIARSIVGALKIAMRAAATRVAPVEVVQGAPHGLWRLYRNGEPVRRPRPPPRAATEGLAPPAAEMITSDRASTCANAKEEAATTSLAVRRRLQRCHARPFETQAARSSKSANVDAVHCTRCFPRGPPTAAPSAPWLVAHSWPFSERS